MRLVGGGVIGGFVCGGGVVGGLVIVCLCVTIVRDISDITGVAIDVIVDILAATVGKDDVVIAGGLVTIAGLVLAHVDVRVVVVDGPVELVVSGGLIQNQFKFLFSLLLPLNVASRLRLTE